MGVPHSKSARVDKRKIHDYLLSPRNRQGREKMRFFAALGYTPANWKLLAEDLRRHLRLNDAAFAGRNVYGSKYVVRGRIRGPSRITADVTAIWIVLDGEKFPRLVTAYPGDQR